MSKTEMYEKIKILADLVNPTQEELTERMSLVVQIYNISRDNITDLQIQETRSFLASDAYNMVQVCYQPSLDDLTNADIELERVEGVVFNDNVSLLQVDGYSKSQSIELARKSMKMDTRYLDAKKNYLLAKNIVNFYDKILKRVDQVLNSMAKRSKND